MGNLGDLFFKMGDHAAAADHFTRALPICDVTCPPAAGSFRSSLAVILAQQGDFDEARTLLELGETQLRGVNAVEYGLLLCRRVRVERLGGQPFAGQKALREAEAVALEVGATAQSTLGKAIAALQ